MAPAKTFVGLLLAAALRISAQPLQITSPADGTAVLPGQSISITVVVSQGTQLTQVGVFGTTPLDDAGPLPSPPYEFSLDVPPTVPTGRYHLTAVGIDVSGNLVMSTPVSINVEPSAPVVKLSVQPTSLHFQFVGQQLPLIVTGALSGGTSVDLTQSSATTYSSTNPSSVTVDASGIVTAVGSSVSKTAISVQRGSLMVSVPVTVPTTVRGDLNGDGVVDLSDVNILTIALNSPAMKPVDARDLNGDGTINALDTRILVTLCTKPGCSTH